MHALLLTHQGKMMPCYTELIQNGSIPTEEFTHANYEMNNKKLLLFIIITYHDIAALHDHSLVPGHSMHDH